MIKVIPTESPSVRVSVARQQEIVDTINQKLKLHPLQGFCFIGKPGTGKTFLMKALMEMVDAYRLSMPGYRDIKTKCVNAGLITLADWQEDNLARSRSGEEPGLISSKWIRDVAAENMQKQAAFVWPNAVSWVYPFTSLHYFVDEFDSQPTVSEFSASKLKTFINSCYENAPRIGIGNSQAFVQLVIAMNKSWEEFTSSYGLHVARRIAEMCIRIDLDRGVVTEPSAPPPPPVAVPVSAEDSWFTEPPAQGTDMVNAKKNRVEQYEVATFEEIVQEIEQEIEQEIGQETEQETVDETDADMEDQGID
jgi:hypothetical protein